MPDSPMPGPESESSGASSTEAEAETPKPEPTYENPNRPFMECPILVWMLSLNREYTVEVSQPNIAVVWRVTIYRRNTMLVITW